MSQIIRRVQTQFLGMAALVFVIVGPSLALAQTQSRLRSNNGSTDSNDGMVSYVPKPDEQLLQQKNIGTSTEQLWQFLADPRLPPWEAPLEEWLKPFHKASKAHHLERFRALERLETRGLDGDKWPYLGTNLKCCYADQPEFVRDVKQVLLKEHERSAPRVVEAAIRLLAHRKPDGFTKQLIGIAPSLVQLDHRVEQALIDALAEAAMMSGKPDPSLLTATKANSSIVRALAIRSLLRSGGLEADAAAALKDDDLTVKWQIAMGLIDVKNKNAIPALIDLITDVSGKRASRLAKLLHHIAGNGPNPALGGDTESRARAHQAWSAWWKEHGESVTSDQVSHGITFAYNDTHVAEVSLSGEILWELEIRPALRNNPSCAQRLANGNFLVSESGAMFHAHGQVLEMTRTGAVIWEHETLRPWTFDRLKDGRTLISSRERIYILDSERRTKGLLRGGSFYYSRKKPDGGFAVTEYGSTRVKGYASQINDGPCLKKLTELNDDGEVARVTHVRDETTWGLGSWHFEFLEKGHLLVCRANDVMELDENRKPVGIFARPEFTAERIQRLANGNLLISTYDCGRSILEEYTRDGKKIGTMKLPNGLHFVSRR